MSRIFTLIKRRKEGKKDDKRWVYELKWYESKAPKHIQTLESFEAPHPEFEAVLQAMAPYACTALDLPADYDEGMEIRQIRFLDEGIRIGAVKELSSGEVVSLPMPLISDGDIQGSPELEALDEEAGKYVDGIRAQLDLFDAEATRARVKASLDGMAEHVNSGALDTDKTQVRMEVE